MESADWGAEDLLFFWPSEKSPGCGMPEDFRASLRNSPRIPLCFRRHTMKTVAFGNEVRLTT
jgi:hypothetical protein